MKYVYMILFLSVFASGQAQQGSQNAVTGGTFNYNLATAPKTLNPLSSTDYYAGVVNGFMVESLAVRNMDTYEWEPWLATSWKVSSDGKTFTFNLRKGVRWHDGKDFTAKDVKFTFDALTDPKIATKPLTSGPTTRESERPRFSIPIKFNLLLEPNILATLMLWPD